MSEMDKNKGDRLEELLAPIDETLKFYRGGLEELERELEGEETDLEEVYNCSSRASFYCHLLDNHFSLDNSFFWYCFVRKEKRQYFLEEIKKRSNEFEGLKTRMREIDEKMFEYIEDCKEGEGEERARELINNGYVPPIIFLWERKKEEELRPTPKEEKEIERAYG